MKVSKKIIATICPMFLLGMISLNKAVLAMEEKPSVSDTSSESDSENISGSPEQISASDNSNSDSDSFEDSLMQAFLRDKSPVPVVSSSRRVRRNAMPAEESHRRSVVASIINYIKKHDTSEFRDNRHPMKRNAIPANSCVTAALAERSARRGAISAKTPLVKNIFRQVYVNNISKLKDINIDSFFTSLEQHSDAPEIILNEMLLLIQYYLSDGFQLCTISSNYQRGYNNFLYLIARIVNYVELNSEHTDKRFQHHFIASLQELLRSRKFGLSSLYEELHVARA